jgi:hypothetical protein
VQLERLGKLKNLVTPYGFEPATFQHLAGIATGFGLDDSAIKVRGPVGSRIYFVPIVQTGFMAHQTSYPMGSEDGHSSATSGEVKKTRVHTCAPAYVSMLQCLVKHRDNYTVCLSRIRDKKNNYGIAYCGL